MRSNETPVIMGFGIPRILGLDSQIAPDGTPLAPPEYLSPEQLRGQPADARSDLYSLAVLTYEMLGGEPPFKGNREALLRAHQGGAPRDLRSINSQVPAWVAAAVARGLEKDPGRRFQGVRQFADALRRNEALATPSGETSSSAAHAQTWRPPKPGLAGRRGGHRLALVLVGGGVAFALLTAVAATAFALTEDNGGDGNGQVAGVEPTATAGATLTATEVETAGLAVGDTATVQGTGEGLRLRSEPAGEQVGTLPDGTNVSIVGGPETAQEITWWQVESELGNGWVAQGAQGATWLVEAAQ